MVTMTKTMTKTTCPTRFRLDSRRLMNLLLRTILLPAVTASTNKGSTNKMYPINLT